MLTAKTFLHIGITYLQSSSYATGRYVMKRAEERKISWRILGRCFVVSKPYERFFQIFDGELSDAIGALERDSLHSNSRLESSETWGCCYVH